jgi:HEAT repeat protein
MESSEDLKSSQDLKSEDLKEIRDILQNIIKAKKAFRMYPQNNPMYMKTLDEAYTKFKNFFVYKDNYVLHIKHNSILYDTAEIYNNPEKEDNLALFFFKDGLRELSFNRGLSQEELEEFLKILALDFDRDVFDDDIVTLLWEKDFHNIQYVVDETVLVDVDEEDYETTAEEEVMEETTNEDDLMKAYVDGFKEVEPKTVAIIPITEDDLKTLASELENDKSGKIEKLIAILFEVINQSDEKGEVEDIYKFFKDAVKFSMKRGRIQDVLAVLKNAKEVMGKEFSTDETKKYMRMLISFIGTDEVIRHLAGILDSSTETDEKVFKSFIEQLDKNAIASFVKLLGELKTIHARKSAIEALVSLGKKDIQALSKGLDDKRWFVVRNIIFILRKIGDKRAIEYLLRTAKHNDIRVRKEVLRALGELGGREVILTLKECLDDDDMDIRITSAKAFGKIGSEAAKRILIDKISDKVFREMVFEEKKEFFEVLSKWKDNDVLDFLVRVLKKRTFFFGRNKNFENSACAAFCLGLLGKKDVLPTLYKYRKSNNRLLREYTYTAIKRLEHGS